MKRIMSIAAFLLVLCLGILPAAATPAANDILVEIVSPSSIDASPIYNETIVVDVTNVGQDTYHDLGCYLSIADVGRNQTYAVDEFGEEAYQTRQIASLAPGEKTTIRIPVRIMYVGDFRFCASVLDYGTGQVYSGNSLSVLMRETSHLNKTLVIVIAVVVPILLAAVVFLLTHGKKRVVDPVNK